MAAIEKELKEVTMLYEKATFQKESMRSQLDEEKERAAKEVASLREQLDAIQERFVAEANDWERNRTEV